MSRVSFIRDLYADVCDSTFYAFMRMLRLQSLKELYAFASTVKLEGNESELAKRLLRANAALESKWRHLLLSTDLASNFDPSFAFAFSQGDVEALHARLQKTALQSDDFFQWLKEVRVFLPNRSLTDEAKDMLSHRAQKLRMLLLDYQHQFVSPFLNSKTLREPQSVGRIDWASLKGSSETLFFNFCDSLCWKTNEAIARSINLDPNADVIDLGGGSGLLLEQLIEAGLKKADVLDCTDRDSEKPVIQRHKISFFDRDAILSLSNSKKFDVAILSWVLHDWNNDKAVEILKNAKTLLKEDGRIFVLEQIQPEQMLRANSTLDILVYMHTLGQERSESEYVSLASQAGLKVNRTFKDLGNRDVLELRR